jgi:predicted TIM-barrel fold metal-dependent hydrolase
MRKQLQEMLVWGMNPAKILFGTDWPISSMESYLKFMDELRMPAKDKRMIMAENSAKVFKIPLKSDVTGVSSLLRPFLTNGD